MIVIYVTVHSITITTYLASTLKHITFLYIRLEFKIANRAPSHLLRSRVSSHLDHQFRTENCGYSMKNTEYQLSINPEYQMEIARVNLVDQYFKTLGPPTLSYFKYVESTRCSWDVLGHSLRYLTIWVMIEAVVIQGCFRLDLHVTVIYKQ